MTIHFFACHSPGGGLNVLRRFSMILPCFSLRSLMINPTSSWNARERSSGEGDSRGAWSASVMLFTISREAVALDGRDEVGGDDGRAVHTVADERREVPLHQSRRRAGEARHEVRQGDLH